MLFMSGMPIRFLRFELDPETYRLTRDARPLALRPKAFDLLAYLVAHRERVVSREELVGVVWGHTSVGPGSLSGLVNELRTALDEPAGESGSIRTVHGRGYQFVAAVTEARSPGRERLVFRPPGERAVGSELRRALAETLRVHGVSEGPGVARLLDRLCEVAGVPVRPGIRRVERREGSVASRLVARGTSEREGERQR